MADLTNCPVCFESYTENGKNIPRVLPCFHTVCEGCIEQLINKRKSLTCPECRTDFKATEGVRCFQQNKYVLAFLQRREQTSTSGPEGKSVKGKFSMCQEHPSKELNLYCKKQGCLKTICQLCLIKKHVGHTVVDYAEERRFTQRLNIFYSEIETEIQSLETNRANVLAASDKITQANQACLLDIMTAKKLALENVAKAFDKMTLKANDQIAKTTSQIEEDLSVIEINIVTLKKFKEDTTKENTLEIIDEKTKAINVLVRQQPRTTYNFGTYVSSKALKEDEGALKEICGELKIRVQPVKTRTQFHRDHVYQEIAEVTDTPEPPPFRLNQLEPSMQEYMDVAAEFKTTCPSVIIIKIEKIVNPDREAQYATNKERQRNLAEGKFWFAPRGISKDLLREQGFNFDYLCRREAPIQYRARGIHFSADAHSAVHDSGAAADSPHGVENLAIYARVLTVANKQTCRRRVQRLQRLQRSHHSVNDVTIANGNLANPDYVVTFI